jgi:hypothetical protein
MALTGTYKFNPSLGEVTLYAYNLCGIRSTSLAQEHFEAAVMAANMLLMNWSNRGVNLWQVELVTVPLVQGTSTYTVDPSVVMILDCYVTTGSGSTAIDRIIMPVSRTEYASYPNKTQQGFPTTYWFDRLLSPTITLWPVPDGNEVSFSYYAVQQIQDSALAGAAQVDIPPIWMEAFAYGLALRLAQVWAPDKVPLLKPFADEAYTVAAEQNVEVAQQYISPQIQGYFR